jgi:hypothetical protein
MAVLPIDRRQIWDLVFQLSEQDQRDLFFALLTRRWPEWAELSRQAQPYARAAAAQRGRDWDAMSDAEQVAFVDDIVDAP